MPKNKKSKEVKQWITIKGNHIPVYEGQTVDDAAKGFMKHEGAKKKKPDMRGGGTMDKLSGQVYTEAKKKLAKEYGTDDADTIEKSC